MADVEYRYPHESSPAPTASWLPSRCPLIDSPQSDDDGVMYKLSAGGADKAIQVADPTYYVTHAFILPWDEINGVNGWRAFRDAVMGREFRVKDPLIGGFITVRLSEYTRTWQPRRRNGIFYAEGRIVMRKAIG